MILTVLWWAGLAATLGSIAYLLLAMAAVARHRTAPGPGWPKPPTVTVLKPLCGLEDGLEEALASNLEQELAYPVCFVFGVADSADPAMDLARRIAARYTSVDCMFVADSTIHGINPKVSNLANMANAAPPTDIVVLSDSDTVMGPGELQAAIDALSAPGVGAVTALYRGRPGIAFEPLRMFGAWLLDYWSLPRTVLHARLGPLAVTYGPLTAIRGEVLAKIGGLRVLADEMIDDNALGQLVRSSGYEVVLSPRIAETLVNDATYAELFSHERRWMRVLRDMDPLGFGASVVTNPGPLPLLLLMRPGAAAVVGIALQILSRWLLAHLVVRRFGRAPGLRMPGPLGLWLRGQVNFAIWLQAFFVSHVQWRGKRIDLAGDRPNGRFESIELDRVLD